MEEVCKAMNYASLFQVQGVWDESWTLTYVSYRKKNNRLPCLWVHVIEMVMANLRSEHVNKIYVEIEILDVEI